MTVFIQFNDDNPYPMLVQSDTTPIHPNQYIFTGDVNAIQLTIYDFTSQTFYKPKLVADSTQPVLQIDLGSKVTG